MGTYDLTSNAEVFAYMGAAAERDAFWLYWGGAAGTSTVQVNEDTLELVDPTNGTTSIDITHADYDTLTELIAKINGTTGWVSGLIYVGGADSGDLVPTGVLDAEAEANKQTLKIKDVYLVNQLIERATDLIERWCDRKLLSRDYTREIYYGSGFNTLLLDQYPVTRVSRISIGRTNAFSILNTSTDANFCTVEVTSTTLRVIVDGGTNVDDTALTLADYATIDLLIAAINALAKGWSITTLSSDTTFRDASELLVRPAMNVDTATPAYVEIPDDELNEYKLINPAEDRNYSAIRKPGTFNPSIEYFVNYTAGYTSTPATLELACIELVKFKYDKSKADGTKKMERMGNVYEYENFSLADLVDGLPPDLLAELALFRKREF